MVQMIKGTAGGHCVLKPSTCVFSSKAYQCVCYSHHLYGRRPSECDSAANLDDGWPSECDSPSNLDDGWPSECDSASNLVDGCKVWQ